ncbi:hypothetical protein NL356_29265, partial [Klebsiella pneumoniae]|nr:hypothetical protein [Klebsiella pneumoniae]
QFIFSGRRGRDKQPDINVVSAEEMATGAYQDWTRQLSAELTAAGDDVQKFFYQSQALGEQRLRNLLPFDREASRSGQLQIL